MWHVMFPFQFDSVRSILGILGIWLKQRFAGMWIMLSFFYPFMLFQYAQNSTDFML